MAEEQRIEVLDNLKEPLSKKELAPIDSIALTREIENQLKVMKAFESVIIRMTYPADWVIHGKDAAYLTSWGAERIAKSIGITWTKFNYRKEERKDHYFYVYESLFRLNKFNINIEIPAMGICSSRDKFFSFKGGTYLPMEEIDETNIMKKAMSHCIRIGVCQMLGLRQMPQEAFDKNFYEKIHNVTYQTGKHGGKPDSDKDEPETRKKMTDMIYDMCSGEVDASRKYLENKSAYGDVKGIRDPKYLRGGRLNVTYDKVKKAYDEWQKEHKIIEASEKK